MSSCPARSGAERPATIRCAQLAGVLGVGVGRAVVGPVAGVDGGEGVVGIDVVLGEDVVELVEAPVVREPVEGEGFGAAVQATSASDAPTTPRPRRGLRAAVGRARRRVGRITGRPYSGRLWGRWRGGR
jgi:hypothetical protein